MALRTRLSLAFVAVVLIPLVVGAIVVGTVVPHTQHDQVVGRLTSARTAVVDALGARCAQATLSARLLGHEVSAAGADAAVRQAVDEEGADYAVVADGAGTIVASAGSLPGAPTARPAPASLGSCARGDASAFAVADAVSVDIATMPQIKRVAVAWSVSPSLLRSLRAGLAGSPQVTLVLDGAAIASTESATDAARLAQQAAHTSGTEVVGVGSLLAVIAKPGGGQPFTVVISAAAPDTTRLFALLALIVVVAVLMALLISWQLARMTAQPLAELSAAATQVAGGDLETPIRVRGGGSEVTRLADAFAHMTAELRTHIREIEHSHAELRRNVDRLGATLLNTHDLGGILSVVLETAMASVRATAGAILLVEPSGDLYLKVGRGLEGRTGPRGAADLRVPAGTGVNGAVVATGEAVRGLTGEGPGRLELAPEEPAAHSVIAVPLKHSGRIIGVLDLFDRDDGREFSEGDMETIRTFGGQASVAVDNVLLHQEAQRLSLTDPLTGLWNYRYFTLSLAREIERATRFDRALALLMLDLDRFKDINDAHGHQVGDAVLVELAERMRSEVREVDTVARYGGEEFVVVLPETDELGARHIADRLCGVVRSTPFGGDGTVPLRVTTSIGVAVFPAHGATASRLVRSADDALYAAKNAGRDGWRVARVNESAAPAQHAGSFAGPGAADPAGRDEPPSAADERLWADMPDRSAPVEPPRGPAPGAER